MVQRDKEEGTPQDDDRLEQQGGEWVTEVEGGLFMVSEESGERLEGDRHSEQCW